MSPRKIGPTEPERKAAKRAAKRTYLLRDVPEDLWQGLRLLAYQREATLRVVILEAIRAEIEKTKEGRR